MHTKGGYRDTIIGAVTVSVAVILLGLVYAKEDHPKHDDAAGYQVTARFNRLDGIRIGSDVRMSGVRIGKVVEQHLAPDFKAVTTLRVQSNIGISIDSAAVIHTDGLLGAKFVEIKPGGDDAVMKSGDEFALTQDSMVLDELLEMIIQQARSKRGFQDKHVPSVIN